MRAWCCFIVAVLASAGGARAAEVIRITPENYAKLLPQGKEVDAIVGDYLLRNDRLLAVVADTVPERKANMTTPRVAGCVIDLTRRDPQSDQLTAYYPGAMNHLYTKANLVKASGSEVVLTCTAEPSSTGLAASVTYRLADGSDCLVVEREYKNAGQQTATVVLSDSVRADNTFTKVPDGVQDWFWVHDDWFGQAYGLLAEGRSVLTKGDRRSSTIYYRHGEARTVDLEPGKSFALVVRLFPADNLVALKAAVGRANGTRFHDLALRVTDGSKRPVGHAEIDVARADGAYGRARTAPDGTVALPLPAGRYALRVAGLARGTRNLEVEVPSAAPLEVVLDAPPLLDAVVTDEKGQPIPCKLQFQGIDGTANPNFGPNTQAPGVANLYYSHNGRFVQPVPPGRYRVLVAFGTEYDLVTETVEMKPGRTTELRAKLVRSVRTPGWISADLHSHSSPSGDNTTAMEGRILNLLAEHIEFAPCTEHNRLDTYVPILEKLGCRDRMATCTGMELTGQPLPLNHQNAFPLVYRPGLQDNGAPQVDGDPEVQIRRLSEWDGNAEKFVQTNHPDLGWMFFDRDGNGTRDAGFYRMFAFQDAIEIWGNGPEAMTDESILAMRPVTERKRNDRLFGWLQLLNLGYQVVGVGNTDAHYTDHGSGWIRNYVRSSTDDPAKVDTIEMVREFTAGHVVVTNGPYLEVSVTSGDSRAIPGDSIVLASGTARLHVRVQCPNWFDINRVQVLLNGRAAPAFNFTRSTHPSMFADGVVKFDQKINLSPTEDTHVIVVAIGEGLGMGDVYGPNLKNAPPKAFSNPISIDVDGKGFQANGDALDQQLPVKVDARKELQRLVREKALKKAGK